MLETDNYSLPLYEGSDAPNLLDGYNAAMRTIDTEIKNANDAVSVLGTNVEDKAPVDHAASTGKYGIGTNVLFGHVQLSDSHTSTSNSSSGIAATPAAVKEAYDTGANALTLAQTASTNAATALSTANSANSAAAGKAPTNHSSTSTQYGVATQSNYGHVKLTTNMNTSVYNDDNMALTAKALEKYFSFSSIASVTESTLVSLGYASSTSGIYCRIYVTCNFDGSLFKVYGGLWLNTNVALSSLTKCGSTNNYGILIATLPNKPSSEYTIQTGAPWFTSMSSSYGTHSDSIHVDSNGNIYIPLASTASFSSSSGSVMYYPASLYFNNNFGDTHQSRD